MRPTGEELRARSEYLKTLVKDAIERGSQQDAEDLAAITGIGPLIPLIVEVNHLVRIMLPTGNVVYVDAFGEGHQQIATQVANLFVDKTLRLSFKYRNWRGKVGQYIVSPRSYLYGSTEWHPEPQYLLEGSSKQPTGEWEDRAFAVKDIIGTITKVR